MKKFFTPAMALIAIGLTSCLQVDTLITVNKDGSGTIREKVLISKTFSAMLREFSMAFADPDQPQEEFSIFTEEKLKREVSKYGEGVTFVSSEPLTDDEWEGYSVTYAFTDITRVKLESNPGDKVNTGMSPSKPDENAEEEYFSFAFNEGKLSELTIRRFDLTEDSEEANLEDEEADLPSEEDDPMTRQFMKMMEDIKMKVSVEVGGKISETNATYVEGSEITLVEMNFKEMVRDENILNELSKKGPRSVEEMKAYAKKIPGMKLELEQPVIIKFN